MVANSLHGASTPPATWAASLKAGLAYFAIVFGAGFVLAMIRIPLLEPRLGARWAELIEMPFMLAVIVIAARWVVRRMAVPPAFTARLRVGLVGLLLLLAFEFGPVLWLRGLTFSEYLATRDPVSGTVYYVMLGVFALLPLWLARK